MLEPLMIRFACQCGKQLQAKDAYAGKRVQCPACGRAPTVPQPAAKEQAKQQWQIDATAAAQRAEQAGVVRQGTASVLRLQAAGALRGDVAVEGVIGCWFCRSEQPFAARVFGRVGIGGSLTMLKCVTCHAKVRLGFSTHAAGKGAELYLYAPSQTRDWVESSGADSPPAPAFRVQRVREVPPDPPADENDWVNHLLPGLAQAVSHKEHYQKVSELAAKLVGLPLSGPQLKGVRMALRTLLAKEQNTYLATILVEALACLRDAQAAQPVRAVLRHALDSEDPGDRTNLPLHELSVLGLLFGDKSGFLEAVQRGMRQLPMTTRACKVGKRLPLKDLIALIEQGKPIDSYESTLGGAHWQHVHPLLPLREGDGSSKKDGSHKSWLDRFLG
jgi:hypothetical protein